MHLALEGHPSGAIIFVILFYYGLMAIFFVFLMILISAIEEFKETEKSDSDTLKSCKKKIILHSIMTAIPLLLLVFLILRKV